MTDDAFDDLIEANRAYSEAFTTPGLEGAARAGVGLVTCMDSRIDPLRMLGLELGDTKVVRNPGGRVTDAALEAMVLAVHLLQVRRILVVPHTRCAMASNSAEAIRGKLSDSAGADASWMGVRVVEDQGQALRDDVARLRTHPLVPADVAVAGFIYDVDTGLLTRKV